MGNKTALSAELNDRLKNLNDEEVIKLVQKGSCIKLVMTQEHYLQLNQELRLLKRIAFPEAESEQPVEAKRIENVKEFVSKLMNDLMEDPNTFEVIEEDFTT
jgi:hypothetical protein